MVPKRDMKLYEEFINTTCGTCGFGAAEAKKAIKYMKEYAEQTGKIDKDPRTFIYQASEMYIAAFCSNTGMDQTKLEKEVSNLCDVLEMEEQGSKILK